MTKQTWEFILSDAEKEHLKSELAQFSYDPNGHCQYINELRYVAMKALPKDLLVALIKQKASLSPRPYLAIHNLPTDNQVFRVPFHFENPRKCKDGHISENLILAIASIVGEPYSISFEGKEIVNNLIPSPHTARDFTGLGSEVELDFHIENAALKYLGSADFSPLGLLLTGVNFDAQGPATLVADGREALSRLSPEDRKILKEPRFLIRVPFRWREALADVGYTTAPVPVIREDEDYPDIAVAFYSDIVTPVDEEAGHALKRFYQKVKEVSVSFQIKPGSLVYIDNRFALHAREAFNPTFEIDGRARRWIQRVFVASNLWNHRKLIREKHRVFNPAKVG